jgi:3D-(3,5/4)-trihydroxycyclohexane-1,2-dione acylhydrolase (decyclizing)
MRDRDAGAPEGDIVDVDYAAVARALGCSAWRADSLEELERALAEARAVDGPALIECRVEPRRMVLGSGAWWDVGLAKGAAAQRFYG